MAQALQVVPVNPVEQVHVHAVLPTFDATDAAWLLQFFFFVRFTSRFPVHRCRLLLLSLPLLCVLLLLLVLWAEGAQWLGP